MGWIHRESRAAVIPSVSVANSGENWITQGLGGGPTSSGVSVTENGAKTLSTVNSCCQILAETVATTSFLVKQRLANGGIRYATEHPLSEILGSVACPDLPGVPAVTAFAFKEFLQGCLGIRGKAYAQKVYSGGGRLIGLNPLRSDRMTVTAYNGRVRYEYARDDGPVREFQPSELLRLHYRLDDDRVTPISPIRANAEALGIAIAVNRSSGQFFAKGSAVSGVLEHPGKLKEDGYKRLKEDLAARTGGGTKSYEGMILEEGMTWKAISINPDDAQALESRVFSVREVCRIYRVPPHLVADLADATFSNIEHQSLSFAQYTMMPWFERWEQACTMDLLTPEDRAAGYFLDFEVEELTRGDTEAQIKRLTAGRQWGVYSANDWRRKTGEPLLGPEGDVYLTPVNMIPADKVQELTGKTPPSSEDAPKDPPPTEDKAAERSKLMADRLARQYRPLLEEAFGRVVAREVKDVRRIVKRHVDAKGQTDFNAELISLCTELREFSTRSTAGVVRSYFEACFAAESDMIGTDGGLTEEVDAAAAEESRGYGELRVLRHMTAVREAQFGAPIEVIPDKIEAVLSEIESKSAEKEAENALETVASEARKLARKLAGA